MLDSDSWRRIPRPRASAPSPSTGTAASRPRPRRIGALGGAGAAAGGARVPRRGARARARARPVAGRPFAPARARRGPARLLALGALDPDLRGGRRGAPARLLDRGGPRSVLHYGRRRRPPRDPARPRRRAPLRRHEIRGNPAGLLARLLRRIDVLKAEAVAPAALREWAVALERAANTAAARTRRARDRVRGPLRAPRPDPPRGGQPRRRRPGARARQAVAFAPTSARTCEVVFAT